MFFEESDINPLLICKICDCKLRDPRILPCGQFICHNCVEILRELDEKCVKCASCGETHEIPDKGFPSNKALAKLVELNANAVSHSKLVAEFKTISNCISEQAERIELNLKIVTKSATKCRSPSKKPTWRSTKYMLNSWAKLTPTKKTAWTILRSLYRIREKSTRFSTSQMNSALSQLDYLNSLK